MNSSRAYDSNSGHAFLFGLRVKKIIVQVVYSNECPTCRAYERRCRKNGVSGAVKEHIYSKSYRSNSSKGMECDGAVEMALRIHKRFNSHLVIPNFVSDDDTSTRNLLANGLKKHLPPYFTALTFLADLNYRVK